MPSAAQKPGPTGEHGLLRNFPWHSPLARMLGTQLPGWKPPHFVKPHLKWEEGTASCWELTFLQYFAASAPPRLLGTLGAPLLSQPHVC